ncbi:uncharacterized protein LOC126901523 [Daktulosphaira vitifoliae]|uniref:uncharacterized protein LOC126901523 n=1 Tax=Daktulosphaira vitifoliae TaxID=58002 RepID=UPI0021AA2467|nr:uncharacterized protein LOC126901523 [Daktulosphaira vitifoliae]
MSGLYILVGSSAHTRHYLKSEGLSIGDKMVCETINKVVAIINLEALFRECDYELCEMCYKVKPEVILKPCLHRVCVGCAFNTKYECKIPSCKQYIRNYDNIKDNGLCYDCKEEASTVTMLPCFHKIGNSCGFYKLFSKTDRCPQCDLKVNEFKKLELVRNHCQNCRTELSVKKMKHCNHFVGQNCINRNKTTKCPVKMCNQIQDHSSENDSEQTCCICKLEETLSVTLSPCYHKICNKCANELSLKYGTKCPLCREPILRYKNIELIERCACKEELRHVVLKPCLHRIGILCANFISNKNEYHPKCPICRVKVEEFCHDEPLIRNALNPSYLRRIKNVTSHYLIDTIWKII